MSQRHRGGAGPGCLTPPARAGSPGGAGGTGGVSFLRTRISNLPYRLGVVAEDDNEAREKVAALTPLTAR